MPEIDTIDADAFHAAHLAAPDLDPDKLRLAIDRYLDMLHVHVSRVHAEQDLSAAEAIDAFRPRTIEF